MVTESVETKCLPTSRLCIVEMLMVLLLMAPVVVASLAAAVTVVALLLTGRRMSSRRPSSPSSVCASSRSLIFVECLFRRAIQWRKSVKEGNINMRSV